MMLYQEYLCECLTRKIQAENVTINDRWINAWLIEHRLTQRQLNRKWKESRPVLRDRLRIFWRNMIELRRFVQLGKGNNPDMRCFDQSPYHMNEAGSQVSGSLKMKGAQIIPLLEKHAATRERWSLEFVVDSRVSGRPAACSEEQNWNSHSIVPPTLLEGNLTASDSPHFLM